MSASSPINPYEPPQAPRPRAPDFSDRDAAELSDLRRRVAELERRVGRSWMVHSNFLLRICGVWGYWILGYALLAGLAIAVMGIIRLFSDRWP